MSVDTQRWDGILSASAGGRIDGSNAVASENSLKVAGVDTVIPIHTSRGEALTSLDA